MKKDQAEARAAFDRYSRAMNLRQSGPRSVILEVFLATESHLTADELCALVRKKDPRIGSATVYRTLKILCESGLAEEFTEAPGGKSLFEHKFGHEHHDHLVCLKCGRLIEIRNSEIERLQAKAAREHGFTTVRHTLAIHGYCRDCRP
jgi:Fur family ferric uptake transcriptional regulator